MATIVTSRTITTWAIQGARRTCRYRSARPVLPSNGAYDGNIRTDGDHAARRRAIRCSTWSTRSTGRSAGRRSTTSCAAPERPGHVGRSRPGRAPAAGPTPRALAAARALRAALDALLRAAPRRRRTRPRRARRGRGERPARGLRRRPASPRGRPGPGRTDDPKTPVHRLAPRPPSASSPIGRARPAARCAACCWLFLDRSRGADAALVLDGRLRHGGQEASLRAAPPGTAAVVTSSVRRTP